MHRYKYKLFSLLFLCLVGISLSNASYAQFDVMNDVMAGLGDNNDVLSGSNLGFAGYRLESSGFFVQYFEGKECLLCRLIQSLANMSKPFVDSTRDLVLKIVLQLFSLTFLIFFVIRLGRAAFQPGLENIGILLFSETAKFFLITLVLIDISRDNGVWSSLHSLFLNLTFIMSEGAIEVAHNAFGLSQQLYPEVIANNPDAWHPAAKYTGLIECTIWVMLDAIWGSISHAGWMEMIPIVILLLLQSMAPVFIILIQMAFVIEAVFKYMVVDVFIPIFFALFYFKNTRSASFTSIRLMISASATVIVAAVAIAFTMGVMSIYAISFQCSVGTEGGLTGLKKSNDIYVSQCEQFSSVVDRTISENNPLAPALKSSAELSRADIGNASAAGSPGALITNLSFWMMYFAPLVSLLLHLKAPVFAAALSSTSDSAASAVGVMAAGKLGAGYAVGKSMQYSNMGIGYGTGMVRRHLSRMEGDPKDLPPI